MNSKESRELVQLAEQAGVVHAIDFNYRYMPLVQQARGDVPEGRRRPRAGRARQLPAGLAVQGDRLELAARAGAVAATRGPWPTSAATGATSSSSSPG